MQRGKKALGTFFYILFVFLAAYLFVHYVGQRTKVIGSSMEPTLSDGDNLIVDKITYRFSEPKRYDIVVFPCQVDGTYFIKRIIGLPGETVQIDEEGVIFINGEELLESYGREVIKDPGLAAQDVVLGEDEYFVLGDNRNDSMDSRDAAVGNVKREDIIGRALLKIYPFSEAGWLTER